MESNLTVNTKKIFDTYNIKWDSGSKNCGESMPLGGYDVGGNVWVENNELFLYFAQSGAFDEYGNMLKAGRIRMSFIKNPFEEIFFTGVKT